jgi:bile salt-stimulated lipase
LEFLVASTDSSNLIGLTVCDCERSKQSNSVDFETFACADVMVEDCASAYKMCSLAQSQFNCVPVLRADYLAAPFQLNTSVMSVRKSLLALVIACLLFGFSLASTEKFNHKTVVNTKAGRLRGVYVSKPDVCYFSFKGIPYARPPVGDLRFKSPLPPKPWRHIRDATEHGSYCVNKFGFDGLPQLAGGSEDCLFLNVYTPSLKGKRAVMFWIHGGALVSGNGDDLLYGPDHLLREDVVLVTINYRLSAFGFLSTGDKHAPGNQGMKDIVLALKWVQQNIKAFGGDPKKVTVFGQSVGSAAVHYLMLSDMAKGLFHKAILQSGTAFYPCLFQTKPRDVAEDLGRKLGLTFNSTEELVHKLREVNFQHIVETEIPVHTMGFPAGLTPFDFSVSVEPELYGEERFLSASPYEIMKSGNYTNIPMMMGSVSNEAMFIGPLIFEIPGMVDLYNQNPEVIVPVSFNLKSNSCEMKEAIQAMRQLYFCGRENGTLLEWLRVYTDEIFRFSMDRAARFYADSSKHPIYFYEFTFDGSLNLFKKLLHLQRYVGASHGDDLLYLFSTSLPGFLPYPESNIVRDRMTKMWTNFARYG